MMKKESLDNSYALEGEKIDSHYMERIIFSQGGG